MSRNPFGSSFFVGSLELVFQCKSINANHQFWRYFGSLYYQYRRSTSPKLLEYSAKYLQHFIYAKFCSKMVIYQEVLFYDLPRSNFSLWIYFWINFGGSTGIGAVLVNSYHFFTYGGYFNVKKFVGRYKIPSKINESFTNFD